MLRSQFLRGIRRFGAVGLAAALALTAMLIPKIGLSAKAAQSEESESHAKGLEGLLKTVSSQLVDGPALR